MDINESFSQAITELTESFGVTVQYKGIETEPALSSANQVNVLIGLTNGIKGNVLLGMTKSVALNFASAMIGSEALDLDELSESAISEFMNTLVGMGLGNLGSPVDFSSPTMIVGENMYLMISKVPSSKLLYNIANDKFSISISIEKC